MSSFECAYCGQLNATTKDHIPPKRLFSNPKPDNLPTVKSCKRCNQGASKDDEYFLHTVLKYRNVGDLPQATQQVAAMYRSAENPNKKRYFKQTLKSFYAQEIRSSSGLILGLAPKYKVNGERLERTIKRYIKGLYKFETGSRLTDDRNIVVICNPDYINKQVQMIIPLLSASKLRTIQEGVFWYAWSHANDDPTFFFWFLLFFDVFPVMVFIPPA